MSAIADSATGHSTRPPGIQRERHDSIGIGKISENQLRSIVKMVKERKLLSEPPPECDGRGIVISAGGKYAEWGLVNAKWIRHQGVKLPIQVWHMGPREIADWMRPHFAKLDVELVDAFKVREKHWHRRLSGWTNKQYAAMRCPWREVLSVDADCFITKDPAFVFDDPEVQEKGAFFCADVQKCAKSNWAYFYAWIPVPKQEMESGYFMWDRQKAWEGIKFTHWIAEHSEEWDKLCHGDKDRAALAFGTTNTPFAFADKPQWMGTGIRHFWKGEPICDHLMGWKRGDTKCPIPLLDGFFEEVRSLRK